MKDIIQRLKSDTSILLDNSLSLRIISGKDVKPAYVEWLNDKEVVQFTEQRFYHTSVSDVISFVDNIAANSTELMYAIFIDEQHIGNIKLGAINNWHKTAALSYLIGAKDHWGKGIASRAISKMTEIGFSVLGLNKITAGVYANNTASARVLEKNNFELEGIRKSQFIFENERIDALLYGKMPQ